MNRGSERRRLLVHVLSSQNAVFRPTPERFAAAAARHPDAAAQIDVRFVTDEAGLEDALAETEIMIGWRFRKDDFARRAPRLRWLHLTGAGIEHLLPLDWAPRRLRLTNSSGVHAPKAGEFASMALLMLNNSIPFHATNQRRRHWEQRFDGLIAGKTLLVVGVGEMGGAAARAARGLGMRVIGVRCSGRPHPAVNRMVGPDELHDVLPAADFLLIAAPLTSGTRGMIGAAELDLLRRGCSIVNIGRAGIMDYNALAERLADGRLRGAVLDVFDPEPLPPSSPLWDTPNLMVIPHCSSDDPDNYMPAVLDQFFDNLKRYLAGRPLRNRIDPRREY